ncbi:MAG: FAD-dependent oxidoreductase [Chthoniobacteraceae bacterium]
MSLNIAIIGAGIAGVSAANTLRARGCSVTLFEKSRGFGGRCATKRWEGHTVDHGAQYFTNRDERFRAAVQAASGDALMKLQAPVLDEAGRELPDSGRWFHRDGNNRLVRDLAHGLDVKTETTIERAENLLRRAGGEFDHVVSTAPFPQTARLFEVDAAFDYVPCLTVLLAYRGERLGRARECYAISDHRGPLAWSACENHKPGRVAAGHTVMVAQMSEPFNREHLKRAPDEFAAWCARSSRSAGNCLPKLSRPRWDIAGATPVCRGPCCP